MRDNVITELYGETDISSIESTDLEMSSKIPTAVTVIEANDTKNITQMVTQLDDDTQTSISSSETKSLISFFGTNTKVIVKKYRLRK